MGSVQKRSWLRALSASSLERQEGDQQKLNNFQALRTLPLAWVQGEKLVNKIAGVLILDIGFQPLLHPPLALLRDLKLLE